MVIKEVLKNTIKTLKDNNTDNAIFEAHLILKSVTGLCELDLIIKASDELDQDKIDKIESILKRRLKGEPLQYILGTEEFMGLEFMVSPSVLIPRQDTEILVEKTLEYFGGKPINVLDLCTGSGCIAISIAHFNKNARVHAIDISPDAISLAKENAIKLGVDDRVSFEVCDVFGFDKFGKYDLIVSNPPYIESDVIPTLQKQVNEFEPKSALDGGIDGLDFYRHIVKIAPKYLDFGGVLAFEIGYNQSRAVTELMEQSFKDIRTIKDYGDNDRVVIGIKKENSDG